MLLATDLAVLDHHDGSVLLIANAINYDATDERVDDAWADAVRRLDAHAGRPRHAAPRRRPSTYDAAALGRGRRRAPTPADYLAGVEACKEHIRAGDAFQIVLSQRFSAPCTASSLDVYRVLRVTNPSPYMYLLRVPVVTDDGSLSDEVAFDVVGSSPEALVKVEGGRALLHPIAGSRPRGATPEDDNALAEELLADEKERAEHLMLVDLGRNDLGRVCAPGSGRGRRLHERRALQPHHAHRLDGRRHPRPTAARRTTCWRRPSRPARCPGAPKPRAMEIIDELEPVRRGVYAGASATSTSPATSTPPSRSAPAVIKDGVAYVQAGAGLVADSVPETEHEECGNKAAAVLRAVAMAATMRPAGA